jgi:hypothetical protein
MSGGEPGRDVVLITGAVEAFLASPHCTGSGNTYRAYAGVLARSGPTGRWPAIGEQEIGAALHQLWGNAAPATPGTATAPSPPPGSPGHRPPRPAPPSQLNAPSRERAIATINSTLSCPNRRKRCFFAAYYGRAMPW